MSTSVSGAAAASVAASSEVSTSRIQGVLDGRVDLAVYKFAEFHFTHKNFETQ